MKLSILKFMLGSAVVALGCFEFASVPVSKNASWPQVASKQHSASHAVGANYTEFRPVATCKLDLESFITSISYSPDGKMLAAVRWIFDEQLGNRTEISLVDASNGKLLQTIKQVGGVAILVRFSPDGKQIATGGANCAIRLWDTKTGKLRRTLQGHSQAVISICFSPKGKSLVSGSYDNSIKVWSTETGSLKATLKGHKANVNSVCYSPDGNMIASGSADGTVKLWRAKTGQLKATLANHKDDITAVCYSPDGKIIVSGGGNHSQTDYATDAGSEEGKDNAIRLWDARTGKLLAALPSFDGEGVSSVGFSPDGKVVASLSGNADGGFFKLWAVDSRAPVPSNIKAYEFATACFAPDGKSIAVGTGEEIQIWRRP
jgi:WD40 repeat protein